MTVSRKGRPYDIGLPGGKVEGNETLQEAAARELVEETGLVVDPLALVSLLTADGDTGADIITSSQCTAYLALTHSGELAQEEGGGVASWQPYRATLQNTCTFVAFNTRLLPLALQVTKHIVI